MDIVSKYVLIDSIWLSLIYNTRLSGIFTNVGNVC